MVNQEFENTVTWKRKLGVGSFKVKVSSNLTIHKSNILFGREKVSACSFHLLTQSLDILSRQMAVKVEEKAKTA
jgi:hypothetical protein